MADNRGNLLPVYMVADESDSMAPHIGELNAGLASLHEALLAEPMAAAKVRFSILGFSDDVAVRMELADLRRENELPTLATRGRTNYGAAFTDLISRIPRDVQQLKSENYTVHRPAVFFFSDGLPTDGTRWREPHGRLTDRSTTPAAPNIIACGVGSADASTILDVATQQEFAFVSIRGTDVGSAIAKFCTALTKSIVASGRALAGGHPELVVEKPDGFRLAVDVM